MNSGLPEEQGFLLSPADCRGCGEPVLVSACFLGIPCRWHGRRAKRRDKLIARLKKRYVLVPVCPEQLGGMPTPRTGETLCATARKFSTGAHASSRPRLVKT